MPELDGKENTNIFKTTKLIHKKILQLMKTGITQVEIAKNLNVSQNVVSRWKNKPISVWFSEQEKK